MIKRNKKTQRAIKKWREYLIEQEDTDFTGREEDPSLAIPGCV
jgi:hypothetical protein